MLELDKSLILNDVCENILRLEAKNQRVESTILDTIYDERGRLESEKNPKLKLSQSQFYDSIQSKLIHSDHSSQVELLQSIIQFFGNEIHGRFNPTIYKFTTSMIPIVLSALLSATNPFRLFQTLLKGYSTIDHRLIIEGNVKELVELSKKGTVILVPTHSSNLDSMLVGYALFRIGLPPFLYGAGLNLFKHTLFAFFMNRLGAYKVDRLKTTALYKAILKEYATVTTMHGCNQLYFPGGGRSRSNEVEHKLKLGLLGTALTAYTRNLIKNKSHPDIFVVPCTINYHTVLEAETLISDHLKEKGKSRFIIDDDEFSKARNIAQFIKKLFTLDSQIRIVIGDALDVVGNKIDSEGYSIDQQGRRVDRSRYVHINGTPAHDAQRDREYTQNLGKIISSNFQRHTVLHSTNVVSHVAFEHLRCATPEIDLYRLLRTGGKLKSFDYHQFCLSVDTIMCDLRKQSDQNIIHLHPTLKKSNADEIIAEALRFFKSYHSRPALYRGQNRIFHDHRNLIYYYKNRLSHLNITLPGKPS